MLDCGMHMGFNDEVCGLLTGCVGSKGPPPPPPPPQRRFPDFSYITDTGRSLTDHLDCVIIRCSHTY